MKTLRRLNRRSFLAAVTGTGTLLGFPQGAGALVQCSDSDSGQGADSAGRGRNCTGITDGDPTDPYGRGRGGQARSGVTDRDPTDPIGQGRGAPTGQPTEAERQQSCFRLSQRWQELRLQLMEPEYWAPSHREYAEQAATQVQALFEADEDGYVRGRYEALRRRAEEIGSTYGGGSCGVLECTDIVYRLRERAARAGGSYNSAQHTALLDEWTRLDAAIRRNCPG
jgi:hypothetical protein